MARTRTNAPAKATRERILAAALQLSKVEGFDALTTRAVAAAAYVQVPTIYRLFGDKIGLLQAVSEYGIAAYVSSKKGRALNTDPVEELRGRWHDHVAFGLANPALFSIMNSHPDSPAAAEGLRVLRMRVRAIAAAGRLRTGETRAVSMLHAAGVGLVMTLTAEGKTKEDDNSHHFFEAILAAITNETARAVTSQQTAAATLRATLPDSSELTRGEFILLDELLVRLSNGPAARPDMQAIRVNESKIKGPRRRKASRDAR